MKVVSPFRGLLFHFYRNAVGLGPRVVPDTGHLPGDFDLRFVGLDNELILVDLGCHDGLRKLADYRKLVAEVAVQRLEPVGQCDHGHTRRIGGDIAVVYIHHVRRLDKGMVEIFVLGVKRVIDLKASTRLAQITGYSHIAKKEAGIAAYAARARFGKNPNPSGAAGPAGIAARDIDPIAPVVAGAGRGAALGRNSRTAHTQRRVSSHS